jgi:serine/threonine protein kinase
MNETPVPTRHSEISGAYPPVSNDDQRPGCPVEAGTVLRERYVLVERLGTGRKGAVFKARDRYRSDLPEGEQYVAIKILHDWVENRAALLTDLRREFYCAQMLSHRNVINVFELDRDGDTDFFTMELLEGELLSSVMQRLHPLPMSPPQAWAIIRDIGAGLEHAHARNVIHGDLKPHNIMITHSGEVRILDFGVSSTAAKQRAEHLRPRNALSAAALAYASCELLEGRPADPRDDIYALACISYELLAGTHPFQRRRSTDARDLAIVPRRLPQLNRQQWQALAMGLSWHRAGRSISVRAWLKRVNAERTAVGQLPRSHELKPAPAGSTPTPAFRATALFAVLLFCVTVWVSVARLAPSRASGGTELVPAVAASEPLDTPPATNVPASPQSSGSTSAPIAGSIRREAGRSKVPAALAGPLTVSSRNYRVRSGQHFAEIRVHRSNRSSIDTPFEWWTEAASAKPGIDYVHQGKVTQSFPKGKNSTSFFVKLVPKASRTQPEMFYIAIAQSGPGATPAQVERAAVWLPTS